LAYTHESQASEHRREIQYRRLWSHSRQQMMEIGSQPLLADVVSML
jgi:hypothetical protein